MENEIIKERKKGDFMHMFVSGVLDCLFVVYIGIALDETLKFFFFLLKMCYNQNSYYN